MLYLVGATHCVSCIVTEHTVVRFLSRPAILYAPSVECDLMTLLVLALIALVYLPTTGAVKVRVENPPDLAGGHRPPAYVAGAKFSITERHL